MFGLPGVQRVGGGVERTEGNKGEKPQSDGTYQQF